MPERPPAPSGLVYQPDLITEAEERQVLGVSGSPYVLAGAARFAWQHSIPSTKALRPGLLPRLRAVPARAPQRPGADLRHLLAAVRAQADHRREPVVPGPGRPAASLRLGLDARRGQPYMQRLPVLVLAPGLAIFLTALSVTLIGQGLALARPRPARAAEPDTTTAPATAPDVLEKANL